MSPSRGPTQKVIFCRHDFGKGRYVSLLVSAFMDRACGSVYGSELSEDVTFSCESLDDGRAIATSKFHAMFPHHECTERCASNWRDYDQPRPEPAD